MSTLWTVADLLAATGGLLRAPFAATGVSIDTRTIRRGDLFVALIGEHGDGHDHAADALAKGAAGVLVHRLPGGVSDAAPLLQVTDTLDGLRALARFARARFAGRMVAVTGSVGKTTTKEMLRTALSASAKTWAAQASHNNHWGVPLTLARLPPDAAFCVVEIGMNHTGEIAPLARLARPDVVLITAVERAHVGYLGSIEAIADEKMSIVSGLSRGGVAVLPADSALLARMRARAGDARVMLFGTAANADARLMRVVAESEGTEMVVSIDGRSVALRIVAPGRHMAMNALAALTCCLALGADLDRSAAGLADFAPIAGRGAKRSLAVGDGTALLLDESYNASSASVRAALEVLALQPATRRIAVLGDMLELGDEGPGEHMGLAEHVAAHADLLFTCGELMRLLSDSVPVAQRAGHAPDAAALAPMVAAALRPGDAVLVKGSLGSRMKLVVDALETAASAILAESR